MQGDARFVDVLASMGCIVTRRAHDTVVMRRRDTPLRGVDVDMADMSDLVPTLAVVATQAVTPTRITGVGFIRAKESDRLGDLAAELRRTGAIVTVEPDGLLDRADRPAARRTARAPTTTIAWRWPSACSASSSTASRSSSPAVVSKSWPSYWDALGGDPGRDSL